MQPVGRPLCNAIAAMASKKGILISILFVVLALVIALPIVVLESRRAPDWQVSLMRYFELSEVAWADVDAVWAAEARFPDRFLAEELVAAPTEWVWQNIEQIPPPERVRCIRLQQRGRSRSAMQIPDAHLVIGYHDDGLHHAGWMVHQFRVDVSQRARQDHFVRMGCTEWKQVAMGTR